MSHTLLVDVMIWCWPTYQYSNCSVVFLLFCARKKKLNKTNIANMVINVFDRSIPRITTTTKHFILTTPRSIEIDYLQLIISFVYLIEWMACYIRDKLEYWKERVKISHHSIHLKKKKNSFCFKFYYTIANMQLMN